MNGVIDGWSEGITDGDTVGISEGVSDGRSDGLWNEDIVGNEECVVNGWLDCISDRCNCSEGIDDGNLVDNIGIIDDWSEGLTDGPELGFNETMALSMFDGNVLGIVDGSKVVGNRECVVDGWLDCISDRYIWSEGIDDGNLVGNIEGVIDSWSEELSDGPELGFNETVALSLFDGNVLGIVDGSMVFIITGVEVGSLNSTCGDIELGIS